MSDGCLDIPAFVAPAPDIDSMPFWEAAREGTLLIQQCVACNTYRWPARTICAVCRAREWRDCAASGRGRVYTWTIIHHATVPTPAELLPYCVAMVALNEDSSILVPGRFEGDARDLRQDDRVIAVFRHAGEDIFVLHWCRDEDGVVS